MSQGAGDGEVQGEVMHGRRVRAELSAAVKGWGRRNDGAQNAWLENAVHMW